MVAEAPELATPQSQALARSYLQIYHRLAGDLPAAPVLAFWRETPDPAALAAQFSVRVSDAMHRLATLPSEALGQSLGLVVADAAGALLFRKAPDGFPVPRYGAACAVWPLYQVLARPLTPQRDLVLTPPGRRFETWSIAEPAEAVRFGQAPILRASMLIGLESEGSAAVPPIAVGTTCRICPRSRCAARREPSVLAE